MTPLQLRTLHAFYGRLRRRRPEEFDDGWFRLAMRNAGRVAPDADGHVSSRSLTNRGMEDVMALIEDVLDKTGDAPGTYWRDTVNRRLGLCSRREAWLIRQYAPRTPYPLDALCRRFSDGRSETPERLTPRQAQQLIHALMDIVARNPMEADQTRSESGVGTEGGYHGG